MTTDMKTIQSIKFYFLLIGIWSFNLAVIGQDYSILLNEQQRERQGMLHVNKSFFTTGEIVWFKGYLPKVLTYQNSLARIDVVSAKHKIISTQYLKVNKKKSIDGYYRVPINLKSDYYYLAMTVYEEDSNTPHVLVVHPLPIFNDLALISPSTQIVSDANVAQQETSNFNDLDLSTNKSKYTPRESITLNINTVDTNVANLSISVTEVTNYPNPTFTYGEEIENSFLVDNEITHSGLIYNPETNEVYETDYLSALIVEEGKVKLFESYRDGRFELDLPYFLGKRKIQLIDYFKPKVKVVLDTLSIFGNSWEAKKLVYTDEVIRYIEKSRKRKKINQLFGQTIIEKLPKYPGIKNILTPDRSLDFEKYQSFKDLEDFFKQITTPFKIKTNKKGDYTIKMVNPEKKPYYPGVPKIMVNGYFIADFPSILSTDIKNIKKIDLFYFQRNLKRQFDLLGSNGIAAIYTKKANDYTNGDLQDNSFESYGGIMPLSFDDIHLAKIDPAAQNFPVLDPTQFWSPELIKKEAGLWQLQFRHGDTKGRYNIEITGDYSGNVTYFVE